MTEKVIALTAEQRNDIVESKEEIEQGLYIEHLSAGLLINDYQLTK